MSKVVLITGASSGIGRATALACAQRGDRLVLAARSPESLGAAEAECKALGAEVLAVPTDITDRTGLEALFAAAVERFGRVDGVVNAAAVVSYGRIDETPAEVFDQVITTNVIGTANVARIALRTFRDQDGGRLVLVGSLLGKIATPYLGSYTTSKWAVHGLARTLRIEARQNPGVHVGVVSPGGVDTPVYKQAASYAGKDGRPPPPVDPPEKVARAILRSLDRTRRERSVGVANPVVVTGFRFLPSVYDRLVTPLMKVGGLSRDVAPPNDGNVFEPNPAGDAVHGAWGRHWLRPAAAATTAATAAAGVLVARRSARR